MEMNLRVPYQIALELFNTSKNWTLAITTFKKMKWFHPWQDFSPHHKKMKWLLTRMTAECEAKACRWLCDPLNISCFFSATFGL